MVSGFVAGETRASSTAGAPVWTTTAGATSQPGQYAIDGGGLISANYIFVQATGSATALTLNPAAPVALGTPPANVTGTTTVLESTLGASNGATGAPANNGMGAGPSGQSSGNTSDGTGGAPASNPRIVIDTSLACGGTVLPVQIVNGGVNMPADFINPN